MSVTLGLMAASAAYSAYQNYQAASAEQEQLRQQAAFHREYIAEINRRQEINEKLTRRDIKKAMGQTTVSAAALGQSISETSTLVALEEIATLGAEQILRDKQEFDWEMKASKYKQEALEGQIGVSETAQKTQLFNDLLGAGMQFSKFSNSGVKEG